MAAGLLFFMSDHDPPPENAASFSRKNIPQIAHWHATGVVLLSLPTNSPGCKHARCFPPDKTTLTPRGDRMRVTRAFVVFVFCLSLKLSLAAVTVGSCQSVKHSYPTISAAIAAAPPGGIVNVCPGTYAEQIEI